MASRKIEASDIGPTGFIQYGVFRVKFVDQTHVELDDDGKVSRVYREEPKPKPKPRAKPKAKKES